MDGDRQRNRAAGGWTGIHTAKPVARTADDNANNVVWLRLYNGNSEAYSGGAGTITLRIEIDQNYTGERREAMITIRSGNNNFTVTVVQEGTKHDAVRTNRRSK